MMHQFISDIRQPAMIAAISCLIVIGAMAIDLIAGLHKARLRNEQRSSWGLKRTVAKFISYIGSLLIAFGIDVIILLAEIHRLSNLMLLRQVPVICCLLAIFLLVVEIVSIRETADIKNLRRQDEIIDAIRHIIHSAASHKLH